jgi:hypothetical protein
VLVVVFEEVKGNLCNSKDKRNQRQDEGKEEDGIEDEV